LGANDDRARLVALLQLAYSGELAAAYAYRGHWRSVSCPEERARIREIEEEEWHHRTLIGHILKDLGSSPSRIAEVRSFIIGRSLGALCHVSGWFMPMYGAGRLESHNIREYEDAARLAEASGQKKLIDCLLGMAEVEWEHEAYFRKKVMSHPLASYVPIWPAPPEKGTIRGRYVDSRDDVA
jgi:rubrerythrin